jgi:hypothetical protein
VDRLIELRFYVLACVKIQVFLASMVLVPTCGRRRQLLRRKSVQKSELGHKDLTATMIYTRVLNKGGKGSRVGWTSLDFGLPTKIN